MSKDLGAYHTFCIYAEEQDGGQWRVCKTIHDVSVCRDMVQKIAEDCTRFQVHPLHLMDIIEDRIG